MYEQLLNKLESLFIDPNAPDDTTEFIVWVNSLLTEEERGQFGQLLESGDILEDLVVGLQMKGLKVGGLSVSDNNALPLEITQETQAVLNSPGKKPDNFNDFADFITRHLEAIGRYDLLLYMSKNREISVRAILHGINTTVQEKEPFDAFCKRLAKRIDEVDIGDAPKHIIDRIGGTVYGGKLYTLSGLSLEDEARFLLLTQEEKSTLIQEAGKEAVRKYKESDIRLN